MSLESGYTEEQLIYQLSQDNERAFTELYNRLWEPLFAIAYNRLKNVADAEDIVQNVFMSVWNNRHTIQALSLKSYLAAAVKYMVLAQLRKKALSRQYNLSAAEPVASDAQTENALHYRGILRIVQEEMNFLPEKCQLIFKYSRQGGMSSQDIAGRLRISPKTVDNQINKALHYLKLKTRHLLSGFLHQLF